MYENFKEVAPMKFKAKRVDTGEWVEGLPSVVWGKYYINGHHVDIETIQKCEE